jgi:hypothetical protein
MYQVLCEVNQYAGFWTVWVYLTIASFAIVLVMSGAIFKAYYANPTYETWRYKSNPKYPTAEMVRQEIVQLSKGVSISIFSPAMTIWFVRSNPNFLLDLLGHYDSRPI